MLPQGEGGPGVGAGLLTPCACAVVTPIGLESGRDVSVCLSQIHKLFFHSLSLNAEREEERERESEMWRMTASVRLGIYGCLSLSLSVKQAAALSLSFSLTHSHDFSVCAFYLRKYLR